jgi:hypothetical protein
MIRHWYLHNCLREIVSFCHLPHRGGGLGKGGDPAPAATWPVHSTGIVAMRGWVGFLADGFDLAYNNQGELS